MPDELSHLHGVGEFECSDKATIVELADDAGATGANGRNVIGDTAFEQLSPFDELLLAARQSVPMVAIRESIEEFDVDAIGRSFGNGRGCDVDPGRNVGLEHGCGLLTRLGSMVDAPWRFGSSDGEPLPSGVFDRDAELFASRYRHPIRGVSRIGG